MVTRISFAQDVPVILKWPNLQRLDKAFDIFYTIKLLYERFVLSEQVQHM